MPNKEAVKERMFEMTYKSLSWGAVTMRVADEQCRFVRATRSERAIYLGVVLDRLLYYGRDSELALCGHVWAGVVSGCEFKGWMLEVRRRLF